MTLWIISQFLFFILFPGVILWLSKKVNFLNWLGPIILCYITGMLLTNIPFITLDKEVSKILMEITIPLVIGLLLLPTNFIKWLQSAGKTMLSFGLCIIAVTISAITVTHFFKEALPESKKLAGMVIGVYTGGTPNMSAIGMALEVESEIFILLNSADIVLGGIYLLFLMSFCHRFLLLFLPKFKKNNNINGSNNNSANPDTLSLGNRLIEYGIPILIALLMLGAGVLLSYMVLEKINEVIVILTITTLGIGASFISGIRRLRGSFPIGEYLLMIFCVAVGSMANFSELINASSTIFLYLAIVMTSSIILHFGFAAIFRIDADTVMITSTAGVYGPAFVPVIAKNLKNDELIVSGLTTGLIGYAVANYIGIAVYYFLI